MFKTLDQLIEKLLSSYDIINENWRRTDSYNPINLRKKSIADILNDEKIWNSILQYRKFMSVHQIDVLRDIFIFQSDENRISVRIKQLNSIEYKIFRYSSGELKGKVPINKCLNDLFGVRIIIDGSFEHSELNDHITDRYPGMKLTDASKNGYVASHLYIMMQASNGKTMVE